MTQDHSPTQQSSRDRIVAEVADKVEQRPSVDASREEIEARAGQSVDNLVGEPVQTFTPLLAENEVLGSLTREKQAETEGQPDDS